MSTDDQNLSLQIDALTHYGIDKLFQEKVTGAKKNRPQLEEMINLLREGRFCCHLQVRSNFTIN